MELSPLLVVEDLRFETLVDSSISLFFSSLKWSSSLISFNFSFSNGLFSISDSVLFAGSLVLSDGLFSSFLGTSGAGLVSTGGGDVFAGDCDRFGRNNWFSLSDYGTTVRSDYGEVTEVETTLRAGGIERSF